jgi:AcrR family transcriptional regulator
MSRKIRRSAENQPKGAALALIVATERLLAEKSTENVSLREITERAGVSNNSAIQYHFGSREGLEKAVRDYRLPKVNERREAYLDELEKADQLDDLRKLVGAIVYPMSHELRPRPEGNYYLRYRAARYREGATAADVDIPAASGWARAEKLMQQTLSYLPDLVVSFRIEQMRNMALGGLASLESRLPDVSEAETALRIELLIDAIAGALNCPVSSDANRLLTWEIDA